MLVKQNIGDFVTTRTKKRKIQQQFKLNRRDYEFLQNRQQLGKGAYGTVMLVRDKLDNQLFAMKIIQKQQIFKYCTLDNLIREIKIQRKLDHPHITKLYDYFEDEDNVYLVLEYAEQGSLYNALRKKKRFSEDETFVYFLQTCLGIDYLHKNKVIHRDIKPENLLLDKCGNVKICDFGWSIDIKSQQKGSLCGTVEYMPPEMIKKEPHNAMTDIWGLGVLLYEFLHGKPPFVGNNDQETIQSILSNKALSFSPTICQEAVNLIKLILNPNPKQRPSIKIIFMEKWMQQKQKELKVDLLDYLWSEPKFKPSVSPQFVPDAIDESQIASQNNSNVSSKSRQDHHHQENPFSSRICNSRSSQQSSQISTSTQDLITLYSRGRKNNTTILASKPYNSIKEESQWEHKVQKTSQQETMSVAKQTDHSSQQPQELGFFDRMFSNLGCCVSRNQKDNMR